MKTFHDLSFLVGVVGPGFKFMAPGNNRINLKYDIYLFKGTLLEHPGKVTSVYFFQLVQKR